MVYTDGGSEQMFIDCGIRATYDILYKLSGCDNTTAMQQKVRAESMLQTEL